MAALSAGGRLTWYIECIHVRKAHLSPRYLKSSHLATIILILYVVEDIASTLCSWLRKGKLSMDASCCVSAVSAPQ